MSQAYLVTHSCAAALSRCRDDGGVRPARGDLVVMSGARGEEIGEVLCPAPPDTAPGFAAADMLRRASAADLRRAADNAERARRLADDAQRLIDEMRLPLLALEADLPLDAAAAVIHVLRWADCSLTPLLERLHMRHGHAVYLLDRSRPQPAADCGSSGADGGCGSCGEGGGCGSSAGSGCGSGSCSRGVAAGELAAYFSALREQMHASGRLPLA